MMFKNSKTDRHTRKPSSGLIHKTTPSIISADMNVLGNVVSEGFIDIDGSVEGNVRCESTTIREHGKIQGDVMADVVQIYGHVEGVVKAKEVHLYKTAHVKGVIMHETLSIEDGAVVDGKFKRTDKVFIDDELENASSDFMDRMNEPDDTGKEEDILDNLRLVNSNEPI